MVGEGIVEKFVGLDMSDADTVFDRCLDAIIKIKKVCSSCLLPNTCIIAAAASAAV
jgi:hypothetical protein